MSSEVESKEGGDGGVYVCVYVYKYVYTLTELTAKIQL